MRSLEIAAYRYLEPASLAVSIQICDSRTTQTHRDETNCSALHVGLHFLKRVLIIY